jgi:hypothetical protein
MEQMTPKKANEPLFAVGAEDSLLPFYVEAKSPAAAAPLTSEVIRQEVF